MAVAVVAVLLSFAPVRAAASGLLSIFRLERIVVLPVSLDDVERLERLSYELGSDFFPGDMEVLTEPGDPQYPATLAEASDLAGFALRAPSTHPAPDEVVVRGEMVTRFEPDVGQMQLLFEAAELSPDLVPPEIDGQPFVFTMPVSVMQIWAGEGAEPLVVMQMPSPTVEFPDEVDTSALGEAMLQLLGLSPGEAAALSASIDWSTTLLLPLPTDEISSEPVIVDGTEGFLLTGDSLEDDTNTVYTALVWQKGGIVYLVGGVDDATRTLEIANSLQ
jgi:hypothetical protein